MGALALWAIPLLPAVIGPGLLLAGRRADRLAGPLAVAAALASGALAALAWMERPASRVPWLPVDEGGLELGLDAAGVAAPLAVVVAVTAVLVLIYARADIGQDEARARFFGFMALFVGGMQLVVLGDDLLIVLIGFELIGACSYALIGFWWREASRVLAANRAFVTTRTADLGLYLAAMAAFAGAGTLALDELATVPDPWRMVMVLGIIAAAAGKSAQAPFSGWLSGAMLGPSPVSALLHSATMVAAGVVLLLKVLPLLEATRWAASLVLWLGVLSAFLAALVALHQEDLKQLLAASTVSQYGYMFAGIGALGGAAATSHLVAHAAFKALLFLIAGVLLHQGMKRLDEMGGLVRRMPVQATLFLIGALSLAALPPLSGFFTKEALLTRVEQASLPAFVVLLVVTLMTAAYATRALLGAFAGGHRIPPRGGIAPHEPGWTMTLPEILLALAVLGLVALMRPPLEHYWSSALGLGELPAFHMVPAAIAVGLALIGVLAAWILNRRRALVPLRPILGPAGSAAALEWFGSIRVLDRSGQMVFAAGQALDRLDRTAPADRVALVVLRAARGLATFDVGALDRATAEASAVGTRALAGLSLLADRRLVDGAIRRLDGGLMAAAAGLSRVQTGLLYQYYALLAGGALLLILYAFIVLGTV